MVDVPSENTEEMGPNQKSARLAMKATVYMGSPDGVKQEFLGQVGMASPILMNNHSGDPNFKQFLQNGLLKYFLDPADQEAKSNLTAVYEQFPATRLTSAIIRTMSYFVGLAQVGPLAAKCFAYAVLLQYPDTAEAAEQNFGPIDSLE